MINTGRRANQKKYHFKRYTKHERHVGIDTKNMRTMNMNMLTYSLAYLLTSLLTYYPTMSCVFLFPSIDCLRECVEYQDQFLLGSRRSTPKFHPGDDL